MKPVAGRPDPIRIGLLREAAYRLDRPSDLAPVTRIRRLSRLVVELQRGRRPMRPLLIEIACEALGWAEELDKAELLRVDAGDELEEAA